MTKVCNINQSLQMFLHKMSILIQMKLQEVYLKSSTNKLNLKQQPKNQQKNLKKLSLPNKNNKLNQFWKLPN